MSTKKWLFGGVFTLLSLGVALAAPPAVHPATGEPLVITCLKGTPQAIDGDLSDWNLDAMTPAVLDSAPQIYTGQASWTGPADCSGKFYLEWDDKNIYLAVIVKDDLISMNKTNGDIWNADAIEVFFGTTNAVPPHAEHYQYGFNANNQKWNWCNMDSAGQTLPDYMEVASSRTPDGYICEVAIEYGRIRNLNWVAGNTIGFHPVIDDTEAADREIQMTWTGREAHDQSLGFGYLILSAEPAIAKELARGPSPADKAVDVPIDTALAWTPGEFAASHDVYLGTAFADVNTATRADAKGVLVGKGQTAATFTPADPLAYGQTYYWRVDEVNGAPDNTIFKGAVWSFTAESYGYPIQPVGATASSSQMNMGPDKTIDGSGLDKDGLHGTGGTTMWLSNVAGPTPAWIQYEFDNVYKLADLKVWNSNGQIETFMGFGAKTVAIEYSTDGATWQSLDNVPEFAKAPGQESYAANTMVSFGGVEAKYVKLTITATWGGLAVTGLAEVQFSAVPVRAFGPQPAAEATGISVDAGLNWRPGREATSHQVFFGTDEAAVADGTAPAQTVTGHTYAPGDLNFGTTYYWKVDEVGAATYPGDVWSFSTAEYALVEDFESYTDKADDEIFSTWIDGFTNGSNGSTVGYMTAANGTFGETITVHSGRQSMPMEYNNVKTPYYSETERTFDTTQNWTTNGADTLSLYFRGRAAGLVDKGNNAFLMSAAGTDIWDVGDQFRFAYKQLSGNGSITMRVDSIGNTNVWAKAGPMIRETIDTGSKNAYFAVTPGSGVSFQWRATASGASANSQTTGLVAPYWVRITRTGNNFKAERSADGKTWTQQGTDAGILMMNNVYIGIAVTSHDAAQTTIAELSNVSTTGTVTGNWQVAAIGAAMPSNDPAPLYLTVEDKAGKMQTVVHPDAAATTIAAWTKWQVPLSDLSAGGVNLAAVKKMTLGVGDKANPKAGGAGMLFIDDIGYGHPVK
jgi:regulation of enolase protein 1 (concanavalin A-like superfamily)